MSGVFGYASAQTAADASGIAQCMGDQMRYLPYMVADITVPQPDVALGQISIGIFNQGVKPTYSHDRQVCLSFCGELYHQEERRAALIGAGLLSADAADAQLALTVYLAEGVAGVTKLDGDFTLAIWDARSEELIVINDRFGIYPHYYAHTGNSFVFAPECKAIVAAGVPRRLDRVALAQYVRFQHFLGDHTWFEDIHLLPAATVLRYTPRDNQLSVLCYWDFADILLDTQIGFDDAVDEATRLFQRAIDARIAPGNRVGVYLSGGLDSRIILAFLDQHAPVTTLSFGDGQCRDVYYAAELARRAGAQHHWFPLPNGRWVQEHAQLHLAATEGMCHWVHAHGISTLPEARKLIDVNLSGWDGEAVLGGIAISSDFQEDHHLRYAPDETEFIRRLYDVYTQHVTWPGLTEPEATMLWGESKRDMRGVAFDSLRKEIAHTSHYPQHRRADYFFIRQTNRRLFQNQIVTMRSAVEVRCPYWDYRLVNFMYSLPDSIRATPRFRRALLTRRAPHLARVPYERDDRLPHSNELLRGAHGVLKRVQGQIHRRLPSMFPQRPRLYADYEQYLRTDLREWGETILFDARTRERGLFDPATVHSLWDRHMRGDELWTIGKLAPLITIELVLRAFFDS